MLQECINHAVLEHQLITNITAKLSSQTKNKILVKYNRPAHVIAMFLTFQDDASFIFFE